MIGIIGKKLGMTQIFNDAGQQIPCTVIEAEPNTVLAVTEHEHARIRAVQLGYGRAADAPREHEGREEDAAGASRDRTRSSATRRRRASMRRRARSAASGSTSRATPRRRSRRTTSATRSTSTIFAAGETVKVTGTTKGRGFQGVVKRWGFGGGPNTHGNTKHRRPGSIGPGTDPSRVIKGKKMPGHYGAERHTQIGLRVEKVDAERNLIYVRGAVAGPTNGIVVVRKQG